MAQLRDGHHIVRWTHRLCLTDPTGGTTLVDLSHLPDLVTWVGAAEEHAAPAPLATVLGDSLGDATLPDLTLGQRLADLDRRLTGALVGFAATHGARLLEVEKLHERRQIFGRLGLIRPTVPSSVLRRALIVESSAPARVYVEDDLDGLALVLHGCAVSVRETDPLSRAWLRREAQRLGRSLTFVDDDAAAHAGAACDVAVINVAHPSHTQAALGRAFAHVAPGKKVILRLRAPWDAWCIDWLAARQINIVDHFREIDHAVLPGGRFVDGAGDLLVVERPNTVDLGPSADAAEDVRAQPYLMFDLDGLVPERLAKPNAEALLDQVASRAAHPEATRRIATDGQRQVFTWFDERGVGFDGLLTPREAHLMLTLLPHDAELEGAVLSAALDLYGDTFTRIRPQRTTRHRAEVIVG